MTGRTAALLYVPFKQRIAAEKLILRFFLRVQGFEFLVHEEDRHLPSDVEVDKKQEIRRKKIQLKVCLFVVCVI